MMRGLLLALAGLALAACSTPPPINCPTLPAYSLAEQAELAAELPADGPETQIQIEDYTKLRSACAVGVPVRSAMY